MENTYTTTRGVTVSVMPIATLIEKQRASFASRAPKLPTYTVTTATGVAETHEHDDVSILDAKTTDTERTAWAEYQATKVAHEARYQESFIKLMLTRGIQVALPDLDAWATEQTWLGIDVPADVLERKFHYVWTEVLGNPLRDIQGILLAIGQASGVPEEAITEAEATFRSGVGNSEKQDAA